MTPDEFIALLDSASISKHNARKRIILEAALGKALDLFLEGKMSSTEWDSFQKSLGSLEQAATLAVGMISALGPQAIPPAQIVAADTRIQAATNSILQAVAQYAPPPPPST